MKTTSDSSTQYPALLLIHDGAEVVAVDILRDAGDKEWKLRNIYDASADAFSLSVVPLAVVLNVGAMRDRMIARALHPAFFSGLHLQTQTIVAAVDAGGLLGVDGRALFAGMAGEGCTVHEFQALVGAMVGAGLLCRVGERYYLGDLEIEGGASV